MGTRRHSSRPPAHRQQAPKDPPKRTPDAQHGPKEVPKRSHTDPKEFPKKSQQNLLSSSHPPVSFSIVLRCGPRSVCSSSASSSVFLPPSLFLYPILYAGRRRTRGSLLGRPRDHTGPSSSTFRASWRRVKTNQFISNVSLSCATVEAIWGHMGSSWGHLGPQRALRRLSTGSLRARGGAPLGPPHAHLGAILRPGKRRKRNGEKANIK